MPPSYLSVVVSWHCYTHACTK